MLEFAYELDYEKYMKDSDVRTALAVIKERVNTITKDVDWKQKMADEWNAADTEGSVELKSVANDSSKLELEMIIVLEPAASQVSGASKASFSSRVKEAKKKEAEEKPEWN